MFLNKIITYKKEEVKFVKRKLSEFKRIIRDLPKARDFEKALLFNKNNIAETIRFPKIKIIAEIKRASPSKGIIRKDFNPIAIAKDYERNGATAISIVTDKRYFHGDINLLTQIHNSVELPILRKDFIIDESQIYESRANYADAFLLIASILDDLRLKKFIELGKALNMNPLIEIHNKRELLRILKVNSRIIGINNRNLNTFKTDINTTIKLNEYIPKDRIVISESGIEKKDDIHKLQKAGVNVFLIGETLMKANDPALKLKELLGNDSS